MPRLNKEQAAKADSDAMHWEQICVDARGPLTEARRRNLDLLDEVAALRTLMAERARWAAEGRAQAVEVSVDEMPDDEKASLCRLGYLTGEVCLDLCRRGLLSGALCNAAP